ncbi:MAG TPA: PKD domain-containing protein [Chitinophagaceae bacterium]
MKHLVYYTGFILLFILLLQLSCKKEYSCEGCINGNKPPIANAGSNKVITLPTDSILLDGSNSSDPDGTISSFLWKKITGPPAYTLISASSTITKAKNLVAGIYQFELKVTDDKGLSATDTLSVTVNATAVQNRPPIANAGPDQNIVLPANSATLDGNGSTDPDNNIVSYTWTRISGASSFLLTNLSPSKVQITGLAAGIHVFELKVTDAGGLFSKDTMVLTVTNTPVTGWGDAGADMIITLPLDSAWINGYYTDVPIPGHQWTKISGPATFVITQPQAPATLIKNLVAGMYQFRLEINTSSGLIADTMTLTVLNDPSDPNTITYRDLSWTIGDPYGNGINSLLLAKPDWFDLSTSHSITAYLQLDAGGPWITMPFGSAGFTYQQACYVTCLYRMWLVPTPQDMTWVGRKSSIKIKIL